MWKGVETWLGVSGEVLLGCSWGRCQGCRETVCVHSEVLVLREFECVAGIRAVAGSWVYLGRSWSWRVSWCLRMW